MEKNLYLKIKKKKLKDEYNKHLKKIHSFMNSFNIKDKNNRIIQSGYEYISDIQKKVIDKYHDEKEVIKILGEEKWIYYKELMKKEKDIREMEKTIQKSST
jgi:hypothetical protein